MKKSYLLLTLMAALAYSVSARSENKIVSLEEEIQQLEQELTQTDQKLKDVERRGDEIQKHYEEGQHNGLLTLKNREIQSLVNEQDALLEKREKIVEKLNGKYRTSSLKRFNKFAAIAGVSTLVVGLITLIASCRR